MKPKNWTDFGSFHGLDGHRIGKTEILYRNLDLKEAKVGYLVKGPENSSRKAMAMGMKSGFGADMNFKEKGTYTISTKVLAGGKKLTDRFTYNVE